jgi:hypothetical protein
VKKLIYFLDIKIKKEKKEEKVQSLNIDEKRIHTCADGRGISFLL